MTPKESIWGDHATILYGQKMYDPSYGKEYGYLLQDALDEFIKNLESVGNLTSGAPSGYAAIYDDIRKPLVTDFYIGLTESNHSERHHTRTSKDDENRDDKPETFDLLGFTHYWGKTRKGGWVVKRKTMKSRMVRSVRSIDQWCRENRHKPVREQWRKLCEKVRGHYGYYGITGNSRSLGKFLNQVLRSWLRWLNRRNSRRDFTWEKFSLLLKRYPLPSSKIVHSVFK